VIPVTHFLYLAFGLFVLGLAGLLFSRHLVRALLSAQLMLAGAGLTLVASSRWWGNHDGQVMAVLVALVGAAQLVMGLAVARNVRWSDPPPPGDDEGGVAADSGEPAAKEATHGA
jgi:NADH-quinone oxidoreductase subunit K